jgi:catechol 2,3-dioxygenase-like lactoylglutathione lyase family enzyme
LSFWRDAKAQICHPSCAKIGEEHAMIDHVSVPVRNLAKAGSFYGAVLAPLGLTRLVVRDATIGFGKAYPEFWINLRDWVPQPSDPGAHICLRAPSEEAVRTFHAAALANGGADDGLPGPRQAAFTIYFGAFILDPDGNKLEAVTFPKREA